MAVKEGKKAQPRPRDRLAGMRYMNPQPAEGAERQPKWPLIR
jgi:hypothetical protein